MRDYYLAGALGGINLSEQAWSLVLELAFIYGWMPSGTVLQASNQECGDVVEPSEQAWNGSYFNPANQFLVSEDATRLAHALASALDDIPDKTAAFDPQTATDDLSPYEYFSGGRKVLLRHLIALAVTSPLQIREPKPTHESGSWSMNKVRQGSPHPKRLWVHTKNY